MTKNEKDFIWLLLQPDHYMVQTVNSAGRKVYKVYTGNKQPIQYFSLIIYRKFQALLKTDKKKRITLNLSEVRKLHGKKYLKLLYKKRTVKHAV